MDFDRDCRYKAIHRIRTRREYQEIYRVGSSLATPYFVIYYRNSAFPYHRLGITTSKKIGTAVVRNRIRRQFRELFRKNRPLCPVKLDLVINARRKAARARASELESEYLGALRLLLIGQKC